MILVDTHVVFWLAETPGELSTAAIEAIQQERQKDGLAIADITLWELAMMLSKHRADVRTSISAFLRAVEDHFIVLPLTRMVVEASMHFSRAYPKDPADRIIGATANAHGIRLITRDAKIRDTQEVPCVW